MHFLVNGLAIVGAIALFVVFGIMAWRHYASPREKKLKKEIRREFDNLIHDDGGSGYGWGRLVQRIRDSKSKLSEEDYANLLSDAMYQHGYQLGMEEMEKEDRSDIIQLADDGVLPFEGLHSLVVGPNSWLKEFEGRARAVYTKLLVDTLENLLATGSQENFEYALQIRKDLLGVRGFTEHDFRKVVNEFLRDEWNEAMLQRDAINDQELLFVDAYGVAEYTNFVVKARRGDEHSLRILAVLKQHKPASFTNFMCEWGLDELNVGRIDEKLVENTH